MRTCFAVYRIAFLTVAICVGLAPAAALAQTTPQQVQAQITAGQTGTALAELRTITAAHPDSGVAWYLTAEAQDAAGNGAAARDALARAEQYAPGLPFAKPAEVAALQSHLNEPGANPTGHRVSPLGIIIGLAVVFFVVRFFLRGRRRYAAPGLPNGYGPGGYPGAPMGPGYGPGGGGGIGSSILGGLAAGAGFAAGERVIDDMMGGGNRGFIDPAQGNTPDFTPDRDDGLNGSPGWDDNNNGGGDFDSGNSW